MWRGLSHREACVCSFLLFPAFPLSLFLSVFSSPQTAKQHSGLLESARGFCMSLVSGMESSCTRIWTLSKDNICQSSLVSDLLFNTFFSLYSFKLRASHFAWRFKIEKALFVFLITQKMFFKRGLLSVFNQRVQLRSGVRNKKKGKIVIESYGSNHFY